MRLMILTSILVSNLLPFGPSNVAQAQIRCSSLYSHSSQQAPSLHLQQLGADLRFLHERLAKASVEQSEKVLDTPLTQPEKTVLVEGSLRALIEMETKFSALQATSKPDLQDRLTKLQKERELLLRNQSSSLLDVLAFSNRIVELANLVLLAKENPTTPLAQINDPDAWASEKMYEDNLRFIVAKRHLIPIPTDRPLSIRDFNWAQTHSFALLNVMSEKMSADGILRLPRNFYGHDIQHALQGTSFLTPEIWTRLLSEISTWPDAEQSAAHALIFDMTHESTGYLYQFKAHEYLNVSWARLGHRLQTEEFYGEHQLAQVSDLQHLFERVSAKIDQAVQRLNPEQKGMTSVPPYLQ